MYLYTSGESLFKINKKLISYSLQYKTMKTLEPPEVLAKLNIFCLKSYLKVGLPIIGCSTNHNMIYFWDILFNQCLTVYQLHNDERISCLELLPNMRFATAGYDKLIKIWDLERQKHLFTLGDNYYCPFGMKYMKQSRILATAGGDRNDGLKIWDIEEGVCLKSFTEHTSFLWGLEEISQNMLISSSGDCTIKIWNLNLDNSSVYTHHFENCRRINSILLSKDNNILFVNLSLGLTKLNLSTQKEEILFKSNEQPLNLQFIQDNLIAISYMNGDLGIWDINKNEFIVEN